MYMSFGDILRELLEINNLSQKQLGANLNIAPSTIGNYVRNIREPDHSTLLIFAKYFNVSVDYLLGYNSDTSARQDELLLLNTYRKLSDKYRDILVKEAIILYQAQNDK